MLFPFKHHTPKSPKGDLGKQKTLNSIIKNEFYYTNNDNITMPKSPSGDLGVKIK